MDENQANLVAEALGGEVWQSGGDIWVVIIRRSDGKQVVISDEIVCEYENSIAFDDNRPLNSILLH